MARKKRKRGRKHSRKHAMPKMKRGRRRKGSRRRNPDVPVWGQVALGGGGFLAAGWLSSLAAGTIGKGWNPLLVRLTVSGVGTLATAAIAQQVNGSQTIAGPLAAGMAAQAGVSVLGMLADKADVNQKKFLGLSPASAAGSATPAAGSVTPPSTGSEGPMKALIARWDASTQTWKDSAGNQIQGATTVGPIAAKGSSGEALSVYMSVVQKGGESYALVDPSGGIWVINANSDQTTVEVTAFPPAALGLTISTPVASLAGTFPPWAGFPGYDRKGFPQQAVSLPHAPSVHGYANYAPAMAGYANYAPAMAGWNPGYEI